MPPPSVPLPLAPDDSRRVPVCTPIVPGPLTTAWSSPASPVPTVRVIAPLLLIVVAAPPKLFCQLLSPWMSKVPLLLKLPPLPASIVPPDHVTTPPVFKVRRWKLFAVVPLMASVFVPDRIVEPVPSIPPPVQVLAPLRVKVPVPVSVPLDKFSAPSEVAALTLTVPLPEMPSEPVPPVAALIFKVPADTETAPSMVELPLSVSVPPETVTPPLSVAVPATLKALALDTTRLSFEKTWPAA